MKEIIKSRYSAFFFAGLFFQLACAWFSIGYNHPDEHFQVLEFCNYKMGHTPLAHLPWEFNFKMRAAILPYTAYFFAKAMSSAGMYNPFVLAFLLRLFTALASWFITCKLCLLLLKNLQTKEAQRLLVLMSLFLWFIPYYAVRFSSENISGILLLYGLYPLLATEEKNKNTIWTYLASGFLLGLSAFIRVQTVFAIAGLVAWLLFIKKMEWRFLFYMALSAIVAIGFNILLDYGFYGEMVFTPFNNFYQNIALHKSEDWGIFPWWFYVPEFIIKAIPPLSLLLLVMFVAGVYKNLRNPIIWIIVPVIVIHFLIPHKELRFLFPVIFLFIYIAALGFDYFLTRPFYIKIHKYIYTVSVIIVIPAFIYRTFTPGTVAVSYYKYLYDNISEKNTTIFSLRKEPDYMMAGLMSDFYRNPSLYPVIIDSVEQMSDYINANHLQSFLYFDKENLVFNYEIKGYRKERIYTLFPSWVLKFNINNWENRAQIWSIYRFSRDSVKI